MLTVEEVTQILDDFAKQKSQQSAPSKGAKGEVDAGAISKKKASLEGQEGQKMYFENVDCIKSNFNNNSNKPFYCCEFQTTEGDDAVVSLTREEEAEPDGIPATFKAKSFKVPVLKLLEHSNIAEKGCDDMVDIDELNPATLLYNLAGRYKRDEVYTYVGPILLALNPFKKIERLYGDAFNNQYLAIANCEAPLSMKRELPPHQNALSAVAYSGLKNEKKRQAIVISGESGSGKTESAKLAMNYLTVLGRQGGGDDGNGDIGFRILACNPILEGFGNSKTQRNDNSSRFGKYTKMYFGLNEDAVYGAIIKNYLLEKSRVVSVSPNERGYHIFYFMLKAMTKEQLEPLFLYDKMKKRGYDPLYFTYLKGGGPNGALPDQHDIKGYNELQDTLDGLKFTQEEQDAIWKTNAIVLHMGQIEFDKKTFDDLKNPTNPGKFTRKGEDAVKIVATLLGCAEEVLSKALSMSLAVIRGDEIWSNLGFQKCYDCKDALAKQLFNNMFNWLVKKMNTTIQPEEIDNPSFGDKAKTVGLLDIFGFENFADLKINVANNNFEQLCINFVNEKLHKLYISAIFEAEKNDLRAEGLAEKAEEIEFITNVDEIIQLIDYHPSGTRYKAQKIIPPPPTGIFPFIDDFVNGGRYPEPKQLEDDIKKTYGKIKDSQGKSIFSMSMKRKFQFQVAHSAESVWYDVREFVERDVDFIPTAVEAVMRKHADKKLRQIYLNCLNDEQEEQAQEDAKVVKKGGKAKTIWNSFSKQMDNLMNEMAESLITSGNEPLPSTLPDDVEPTDLHFIRCIKPRPKPQNEEDRPGLFVYTMTLQQITYMGVLESVELKQRNFPFRKKFEDFYAEYELLSPRYAAVRYYQMNKGAENFEQLSKNIVLDCMKDQGQQFYALGTTKIMMMPETREILAQNKLKASRERNQQADVLKKAFPTNSGVRQADRKREAIRAAQIRYKLKYSARQRKYAVSFRDKFEQSITGFKAEKRKVYELHASQVFKNIQQKHLFRNRMTSALKAREVMARANYTSIYIKRMQKFLICSILTSKAVNDAFSRAQIRMSGRQVWNVQRAFRGFQYRKQGERMTWVKEAIAAKQNLKLEVSAKKVQKNLKGLIVRRRIDFLHRAASKVQSHFRMRWYKQVYQMIMKNCKILQRGMRKYMARRDMIKERMKEYLMTEYTVFNNYKEMEQFQLFGNEMDPSLLKHHSPYGQNKIFLFNRVADIHVLTDLREVFPTPWSAQWMKVYKDGMQADKPVMQLEIGATHSIASTGKGIIYSWGWNDNGQCGKDPDHVDEVIVGEGNRKESMVNLDGPLNNPNGFDTVTATTYQVPNSRKARQILAVGDRSFILTRDTNELIAWGSNEKGQLGLGHFDDVHMPTKIDFFTKVGQQVHSVSGGGDLNMASTHTGDSYVWPYTKQGKQYSVPVRMPFSAKVKIARVSCGHNFGFFISSQGLVYSLGKDNSDGQLGLGHVFPNDIPELMVAFKEAGERIDSIECGFRHAIARSTLGKVYTWGWNLNGQLGQGHYDSELSPRILTLERGRLNKDKAIQIAAGYSHSIIMTDNNRELLWFGSTGVLNRQAVPVPMQLTKLLPSMFPDQSGRIFAAGESLDFAVVKISCSWSKSMSITNFMIADLRAVNEDISHTKLQNAIKQLSTQWDQREVMPPYIDPISGLFSATVMNKRVPGTKNTGTGVNAKGSHPLNKTVTTMKKERRYDQQKKPTLSNLNTSILNTTGMSTNLASASNRKFTTIKTGQKMSQSYMRPSISPLNSTTFSIQQKSPLNNTAINTGNYTTKNQPDFRRR